MIDEQIMIGTEGILVSPPEQNGLELNAHLLQDGEWLELRVFGSWIPGQVAKDHTGWYLLPPEGVGIRLRAGSPARLSEGSIASAAHKNKQMLPPILSQQEQECSSPLFHPFALQVSDKSVPDRKPVLASSAKQQCFPD